MVSIRLRRVPANVYVTVHLIRRPATDQTTPARAFGTIPLRWRPRAVLRLEAPDDRPRTEVK